MNQKGFIKILVVFLIIIIGVGVYFVSTKKVTSPTPIKISDLIPTPSPIPKPTPKQITPSIPNNSNKFNVIISTDKTEYDKGEIIRVAVNNKLSTFILYSSGGDRFWGIEYFDNGKWVNPPYDEGGGFQLTEKNIGDTCYIALYERMPPVELKSGASISHQWNQKICPFGTASPAEPRIVKYIGSGQYRLTFTYGFKTSSDDPYKLSDFKTVYSNSFTIK